VLIEHYPGAEPFMSKLEKLLITEKASLPAYSAVRSQNHLYVEYATGEREFYDLQSDPAELSNLYKSADKALIRRFSEWLLRMKSCRGSVCRQSEETALENKVLTHGPSHDRGAPRG
jgi:hypothetical protein